MAAETNAKVVARCEVLPADEELPFLLSPTAFSPPLLSSDGLLAAIPSEVDIPADQALSSKSVQFGW